MVIETCLGLVYNDSIVSSDDVTGFQVTMKEIMNDVSKIHLDYEILL